jgi:5-methylcytosine-specific restriction endonuclease McrA
MWTEAKFNSFIRSQLRQATRKWAPITETLKRARVARGLYLCAHCKEEVAPTYREGRKRVKNVFVDHINPITDPTTGFTNWDDIVNNMFCEMDNLQLLCKDCHDIKTQDEKEIAVHSRAARKELQDVDI